MSTNTFESTPRELHGYGRNGDAPAIREIRVDAGETKRIEIGDGETLTNVRIDITAPGAAVDIRARGSGWELSHIAVVGKYENPGGTCIRASVPDPDGHAVVRDIYLGDGNADANPYTVESTHTGVLDVLRIFARAWKRGFDCSPPGNPPSVTPTGDGGRVRMGACHAEDIDEWAFRFGSSGSICQACVAKDCGRGFWERWQQSDHHDCNSRAVECWFAGNPDTPPQMATARVRGCAGTGAKRTAGPGVIDGTVTGSPALSPPDGCPTTTEAALLDDDELSTDRNEGGESFSFIDPEDV